MNNKENNEFKKFLITILEYFDYDYNVEIYATAEKIHNRVRNILNQQQSKLLTSFEKYIKEQSNGFVTISEEKIIEFLNKK